MFNNLGSYSPHFPGTIGRRMVPYARERGEWRWPAFVNSHSACAWEITLNDCNAWPPSCIRGVGTCAVSSVPRASSSVALNTLCYFPAVRPPQRCPWDSQRPLDVLLTLSTQKEAIPLLLDSHTAQNKVTTMVLPAGNVSKSIPGSHGCGRPARPPGTQTGSSPANAE